MLSQCKIQRVSLLHRWGRTLLQSWKDGRCDHQGSRQVGRWGWRCVRNSRARHLERVIRRCKHSAQPHWYLQHCQPGELSTADAISQGDCNATPRRLEFRGQEYLWASCCCSREGWRPSQLNHKLACGLGLWERKVKPDLV